LILEDEKICSKELVDTSSSDSDDDDNDDDAYLFIPMSTLVSKVKDKG